MLLPAGEFIILKTLVSCKWPFYGYLFKSSIMKYLLGIIGIIVLGFVTQSFFAWWTIALVAALVGAWMKLNNFQSYLVGFLGVFLLWGAYAAFLNSGNEGILAGKIGAMFGGLGAVQMVLVTAILGGIIGGFAALTGRLFRSLLNYKK